MFWAKTVYSDEREDVQNESRGLSGTERLCRELHFTLEHTGRDKERQVNTTIILDWDIHTNPQTLRQTDIQSDRHPVRQTLRSTDSETNTQTDRHSVRQTNRHSVTQPDRLSDRQRDIHTNT